MKTIKLGKSNLDVPQVAVGCMRMNDKAQAADFIAAALEMGANFFDHADIYGRGACEEIFAEAAGMNASVREKMIIQSKCAIVPGKMYDFSKEHILASVDGILKRLKTEYLDVLLLHRPDTLMEPEEVAEAFDTLEAAGKVRNFGVSNQNPATMRLLQKFVKQPLVANQLQFSLAHAGMVTGSLHVNMTDDGANMRDGGVLEFCRLNDITIQPWSPFQHGMFRGTFIGNPDYAPLNAKIDELAEKYGVTNTTIAIAWILRHPAKMQPVVGTMNISRLQDCVKATEIALTREEWYALYLAAGNNLP